MNRAGCDMIIAQINGHFISFINPFVSPFFIHHPIQITKDHTLRFLGYQFWKQKYNSNISIAILIYKKKHFKSYYGNNLLCILLDVLCIYVYYILCFVGVCLELTSSSPPSARGREVPSRSCWHHLFIHIYI